VALSGHVAHHDALTSGLGPFLLGVVWQNVGDPEDVLEDGGLVPVDAVVKGNSGLAVVRPSSKTKDTLDSIPSVRIMPLSVGAGTPLLNPVPTVAGSYAKHG